MTQQQPEPDWRATVLRLAVMLDTLEWSGVHGSCPMCHILSDTIGGHDPDCTLSALLSTPDVRRATELGWTEAEQEESWREMRQREGKVEQFWNAHGLAGGEYT